MPRRVTASSWKVTVKDKTGAIINFECKCPNCGEISGDFISVGPESFDDIDNGFIVEHDCDICGEELEVICNPL